MQNKKLIIIISSALIFIILISLGFYFFIYKNKNILIKEGDGLNADVTSQLPSENDLSYDELNNLKKQDNSKIVSQIDKEKNSVVNTSKFFVEMLGSYSSAARFKNIIDLKPMMTNKMQKWADDFIKRNLPKIDQSNERITTKVFKSEILNFNTNSATVFVYTRREKLGGQVYNQDAKVNLVKISEKWLVDSVEWR